MEPPSISQINRLGDRLRKGQTTEADLQMLAAYERAFEPSLAHATELVRSITQVELAVRPEKSVRSIVRKLQREQTRLSKMQDLAGFRVVVEDIEEQDSLVAGILATSEGWRLVDRRREPVHGYRAVHLILQEDRWFVEFQVRTRLQHLWANLSEAWDRELEGQIKYGEGPPDVIKPLGSLSLLIARLEGVPPSHERDQIRRELMALLASIAGTIALVTEPTAVTNTTITTAEGTKDEA